MYEWENKIDKNRIAIRIVELRAETKRISNVTLRGDFKNQDDRTYWQAKLKKLTGELSALEQMK
jgi:hypothetical protein